MPKPFSAFPAAKRWLVLSACLLAIGQASAQSTTFWMNGPSYTSPSNMLTELVLNHSNPPATTRSDLGSLPTEMGDLAYRVTEGGGNMYGTGFDPTNPDDYGVIYAIDRAAPGTLSISGYIASNGFNNSLSADQFGNIWTNSSNGVIRYFQISDLGGSTATAPYAVPAFTNVADLFGAGVYLESAGDAVRLGNSLYTTWLDMDSYEFFLVRTDVGTSAVPVAGSSEIVGKLPENAFGLTNDRYGNLYAIACVTTTGCGLYQLTLPAAPDASALIDSVFVAGSEGIDGQPWNGLTSDAEGRQARITIQVVSTGGTGSFDFTNDVGFDGETITTASSGVSSSGTTHFYDFSKEGLVISTGTLPAGFTLDEITCTGIEAGGTVTPTVSGSAGGSVALDDLATPAGSDIVCTFAVSSTTVTPPAPPSEAKPVPVNAVWSLALLALGMAGGGAVAAKRKKR